MPDEDPGEDGATRLPWRKNLLCLFGIAYFAVGGAYGADLAATAGIDGYVSQAELILEVMQILTIGAVALAKDMIR